MDSERLKDHLMSPVQEFNEQEVLNQPDVGQIFLIWILFYFAIMSPFSIQHAGKIATCVELEKNIYNNFPEHKSL